MDDEEYKKAVDKVIKLCDSMGEAATKQTCFLALLTIELMGQKAVNLFGAVCDSYFKAFDTVKTQMAGSTAEGL